MIKYFSKLIIIFILAAGWLHFSGIKSISVKLADTTQQIPVDSVVCWAFGLLIVAELLLFALKGIVYALKKDVLLSNHAFETAKTPLIDARPNEDNKMVEKKVKKMLLLR